jgi:hypothetical protein
MVPPETVETLLAKREALETALDGIEKWVILFGVLVVIGVGGETVFGVRAWWNNRKLHAVQQAIEDLSKAEIAKLNNLAGEANKEAGTARKEAGAANERAGNLEVTAAALRQRAAIFEKDSLELRRQLTPRIITSEQTVRLIGVLSRSAKGPVAVLTHGQGDSEVGAFASDIRNVLTAAGWRNSFAQASGSTHRGVRIIIRSGLNPPVHASILQRAFESEGFSMDLFEDPRIAEGMVQIEVGPKP